ncbi:1263_t:CDS:10 [Ambispora leptoticha]|uniref:1263_t:CDS:1 n=1 Tax=Ambispora leptoticha TaxID=144679 RepID=A0A9N9FUF5_9GLOM|nr:1263_t:CDS:10 [Ambispora leptoticha]
MDQQQRQQQFLLQQLHGQSSVSQPQMIQQQYGISTIPTIGQLSSVQNIPSLGGSVMPAGVLALSQRMMPQQNPQQQYNTSGLQGNAKIPWAVTPEEKAQYRDIFKAWDTEGNGYISGEKGREVFSQSGLPANVLMQIWNLADPNNQGKLNQDEFAVAMHLIYRKLNGYEVPATLPPELIPPSSRDLAESVDLVKNILATDLHNQRTGLVPQLSSNPYVKSRSFTNNQTIDIPTDAVSYKHKDDDVGYVSSARRQIPSVSREYSSSSYSSSISSSRSDREKSSTNLADLRKQIHEKEILLEALSYSADTAPIASYNSIDVEEIKRQIKDIQSQLVSLKSNSQNWQSKEINKNSDELNSLLDRNHDLEDELNNFLYTIIPDMVRKVRDTDNKVAEARIELFKLRESRNSDDNSFANIVGTGPGGSITQADRIQAKAAEMLQARLAAITGKPVSNISDSASNPGAARRLDEEMIKVNADKANKENRISDIEQTISRLQDSIIRISRERDDVESTLQLDGFRFSKEDRKKWEDGIGINDEVRRFIEELNREGLKIKTRTSYNESDYESRYSSYGGGGSSSIISTHSTPTSTTSNYSSFSSPVPSSSLKGKTSEERAAFIKAEAERRMQEKLKAFGITPSTLDSKSTPSPTSGSPSITDRLARERAEANERIARAERENEERERTRAERLLADKQKKAEEENERARRLEEYERREAERRKQWLSEAEELEKAKDRKAREKEEAARSRELENERKRLEEVEKEKREREEHLARIKREAEERVAEEERLRKEQEAILEGARAARERAKKLEEEAKEREELLKREAERLSKAKKEESIPQVKSSTNESSNIVSSSPVKPESSIDDNSGNNSNKRDSISTNPFLKFGAQNTKAEEPVITKPIESTNPFFRFTNAAAFPTSNPQAKEPENDDWDVVNKDESDSDDDFGIPGDPKLLASKIFGGFGGSSRSSTSETIPSQKITAPPSVSSASEPFPSSQTTPSSTAPVAIPTTSPPIAPPPPPPSFVPTAPTVTPNSAVTPSPAASNLPAGRRVNDAGPSSSSHGVQSSSSGSPGPSGLGSLFSGGIPKLKSRADGGHADSATNASVSRPISLEKLDRRISTDWYGSLASDQLAVEEPSSQFKPNIDIQTTLFEEKEETKSFGTTVQSPTVMTPSIEQDVDFSQKFNVLTLYPYEGTRTDDLAFQAGVSFFAHPSKDPENANWWYGSIESSGKKGWFPKTYVQIVKEGQEIEKAQLFKEEKEICKAKVLWDYKGLNEGELDIKQGNIVSILDKSLGDWWKAEYEGTKGVVPANYVEEISSSSVATPNKSSKIRTRSPSPTRLFGTSPITPVPWIEPSGRRLSINALSDAGLLPHGLGLRPDSPAAAGQRPPSQTWSSLMDLETVEALPKEERKRQEGIYELINTEQSYLRDLQMIVEVFYGPLQSILDAQELMTIFSNIEDILLCNTAILSDLEQRQRDEGFYVDSLGDILIKHVDSLRCYVTYCGNQLNASKFLQKKRTEDQRLEEFLKKRLQDPQCRSLDLSSYLLKPLQRITRYPLLFRQILHYTEKDHPDHEKIMQSLKKAEDILEETNEAAREQENQVKLAEISKLIDLDGLEVKLDLTSMTRLLGKRQFVMEGPLQKAKSNRKLHGYLFNDLLILAQESRNSTRGYKYFPYRPPFPLNEIAVRDLPQGKFYDCFQIIHIADKINLRARDVSVKRQWVNQLETASGYYGLPSLKDCIGTLKVVIYEGQIPIDPAKENVLINTYCQARLNRQVFKTKIVKENTTPRWNQLLLFSVTTLEDTLKLSLYNHDKFTQDSYLGQAEISLRFLEHYGNNETDKIKLQLKDVPPGRDGSISIYLCLKAI